MEDDRHTYQLSSKYIYVEIYYSFIHLSPNKMMKKVPFVNTTRPLPDLMPSSFAPFQIQMLMLSREEKSPFPFKRRVVECKSILDKIPLLKLYSSMSQR